MEGGRPWHPFRHPGLCGLRGTLCFFFVFTLIFVLPFLFLFSPIFPPTNSTTPLNSSALPKPPAHQRTRRYVAQHHDHDWLHASDNPAHPYQMNSWWCYANYTAHQSNHSNCDVCSFLPISSTSSHLRLRPVYPSTTADESLEFYTQGCLLGLSSDGFDSGHYCFSMAYRFNSTLFLDPDPKPTSLSVHSIPSAP